LSEKSIGVLEDMENDIGHRERKRVYHQTPGNRLNGIAGIAKGIKSRFGSDPKAAKYLTW
jgi:hypothetical protein